MAQICLFVYYKIALISYKKAILIIQLLQSMIFLATFRSECQKMPITTFTIQDKCSLSWSVTTRCPLYAMFFLRTMCKMQWVIRPGRSGVCLAEVRWCSPTMGLRLTHTGFTVIYRQVSNIRRSLVGNEIVDLSDAVGASPVGVAPTTSSFST